MKFSYNSTLSVTTIEIDTSALIIIISVIVAIITYVGILDYRFRTLENHPFLKGLRRLQEDQMVDLARGLIKKGESDGK